MKRTMCGNLTCRRFARLGPLAPFRNLQRPVTWPGYGSAKCLSLNVIAFEALPGYHAAEPGRHGGGATRPCLSSERHTGPAAISWLTACAREGDRGKVMRVFRLTHPASLERSHAATVDARRVRRVARRRANASTGSGSRPSASTSTSLRARASSTWATRPCCQA